MASPPPLLWADLHNHNEIGYGEGSLERSYRIAENSLDVYALSVHGHWPDPPADDPRLVESHRAGFARVGAAFPEVVRAANDHYAPGRFVSFSAFEWHSLEWGDYVVVFPGDSAELLPAGSLSDLQAFARRSGALLIPHHVGYPLGSRGLDWSQVDFGLSPLVEIFSEHGSSWERDDPWPMVAHSMGGSSDSQSVQRQLARGLHFGFTAGTDNHFGFPGSHGEGLTGIYAEAATREEVFAALRRRRTLAVTGDRTELFAEAAGALPGDVLPASAERTFRIRANGLSPIDCVEVLKNGRRDRIWPGIAFPSPSAHPTQLTRIEWGWGRLGSADQTRWRIRLRIEGGEWGRVVPCLGGGAAALKEDNLIERSGPAEIAIRSFTSRLNPSPIGGVVAEMSGSADSRLECEVEAEVEGAAGGCRMGASFAQMRKDDHWSAVLPRFSSPKIRLGIARPHSELSFETTYRDERPGPRDTYLVKLRQTNGQTAWTSPFLFADNR